MQHHSMLVQTATLAHLALVAAATPSPTSAPTAAGPSNDGGGSSSTTDETVFIITAAVIGGVALIMVLVAAYIYFFKILGSDGKKKKKKKGKDGGEGSTEEVKTDPEESHVSEAGKGEHLFSSFTRDDVRVWLYSYAKEECGLHDSEIESLVDLQLDGKSFLDLNGEDITRVGVSISSKRRLLRVLGYLKRAENSKVEPVNESDLTPGKKRLKLNDDDEESASVLKRRARSRNRRALSKSNRFSSKSGVNRPRRSKTGSRPKTAADFSEESRHRHRRSHTGLVRRDSRSQSRRRRVKSGSRPRSRPSQSRTRYGYKYHRPAPVPMMTHAPYGLDRKHSQSFSRSRSKMNSRSASPGMAIRGEWKRAPSGERRTLSKSRERHMGRQMVLSTPILTEMSYQQSGRRRGSPYPPHEDTRYGHTQRPQQVYWAPTGRYSNYNNDEANREHSQKIARKIRRKGARYAMESDTDDLRSLDTSDMHMPMPGLLPSHHRRQRSDTTHNTKRSMETQGLGWYPGDFALDIKRMEEPQNTTATHTTSGPAPVVGGTAALASMAMTVPRKVEDDEEDKKSHKTAKSKRAEPMTYLGLMPIFNERDLTVSAPLGKGPLTQAFLVHLRGDRHQYVLKVPDEENDLNFQIMKELKTIEDLCPHPNVLVFSGLVPHGPKICLLSDYAEMGSLDRLHHIEDMTKESRFLEISRDVAAGLDHLHDSKILHRNLSCRNLLMKRNGTVLLSDYGSSQVLSDKDYKLRRNPKLPVEWAAPEVLLTNEHSFKSDVWSMGVTFWEILTKGKRPYSSLQKKMDLPQRQLADQIAAGSLTLKVPMWVSRKSPISGYVVRQCLQFHPSLRPTASTLLGSIRLNIDNSHNNRDTRDGDESTQITNITSKRDGEKTFKGKVCAHATITKLTLILILFTLS